MLRLGIHHGVLLALFLLVQGRVAHGATPARPVELTASMVAAGLEGLGLQVDAAQVELPAHLSAASESVPFRVTAAEVLLDGRLRLRLACRQPGDCLPFQAVVRTTGTPPGALDLLDSPRGVEAARAPRAGLATKQLRAGQHATLVMEDGHMRIMMPVLAVDSGATGAEVRVSSLDHKRIYQAVVADSETVQGRLP